MEIKGYKGFSSDRKNQNNEEFEEGKIYTAKDEELFFGENGNGFHFCKNLEDCFTYFSPEKGAIYAEVTGMGNVKTKDDETTDSYGIYVSKSIRIDKFLTREEIIEHYLNEEKSVPINGVIKFLRFYQLTEEELERFEKFYIKEYIIIETIAYYQKLRKHISENKKIHEYRNMLKEKYDTEENNKIR